jgi:allophanate hydrolase
VMADPVRLNTNLGFYTNFVNLMDLAAVAVPAGFRRDGLPFGISLIGPAFLDQALLRLAARYLAEPLPLDVAPPGCVLVAVVGAHLSSQPLNCELTRRRARLVKCCRTAPDYRLYALNAEPPKPGLIYESGFVGPGIEVELWAVPENEFGGFVAAIPAPLAMGNVTLDSGTMVKGFICEHAAVSGAKEITHFGGWLNYLALRR